MKYKRLFVMSKFVTMEDLLKAKVKYLESEVDHALQRLHRCKRRSREDKVRLRNTIATMETSIMHMESIEEMLRDQLYPED